MSVSWLYADVFAMIGLWFALGSKRRAGNLVHTLPSLAMIAMIWPWGGVVPGWLRGAVLAPVALWFLRPAYADDPAHLSRIGMVCRLHHGSMAAVMCAPMPEEMSWGTMADPHAHLITTATVIGDVADCYLVISGVVWLACARPYLAPCRG